MSARPKWIQAAADGFPRDAARLVRQLVEPGKGSPEEVCALAALGAHEAASLLASRVPNRVVRSEHVDRCVRAGSDRAAITLSYRYGQIRNPVKPPQKP